MVKDIGDYSNKQHKDLIGLTINLVSKIKGLAKENGILIGDIRYGDFMHINEHVLQSSKNILHPKMKSLFSSYVDQIP
jgi:ribose 5-phosphate isomerase RpiB